jgi:regulator of RNase E activity RraA
MKKSILFLLTFMFIAFIANAQQVVWQPDVMKKMTPEWKGERYPDGRPKVPETLLERLKACSHEEIQSFLGRSGYANVFENFSSLHENGWIIIHPERVMTGRALTAQFLPTRPDYQAYINAQAKDEGTHTPVTNYAPIIKLQEGDIYVCDGYGKIEYGTMIGSNLGNAIANQSKRGVVFNCSVRDIDGLEEIGETFNGWVRGYDPTGIRQMMCSWINAPIRIGRITIMSGDALLCNKWGITIIPPHLLQGAVIFSEYTALRDEFNFYCIKNNIFPYINEAFVVERDVFEKAFRDWINKKQDLPMPREELNTYMKQLEEERAKREAASAAAKKGVSSEIDNH